ncbi:MAG TPA: hypothetical protein VGM04_06080 [Sphingomicrobium sp.]|jgi:hypothetical protein
MAVEKDQSAWLPEPPPPRPARRDAAIETALRRFDGVEDAAPAEGQEPRRSWASTHRPAFAVLVSAMLLVVVGIPAAMIGIRNTPPPTASSPQAAVPHDTGSADLPTHEAQPPSATQAPPSKSAPAAPALPEVEAKPAPAERVAAPNKAAREVASPALQMEAQEAPMAAAAPPAPAPPPPPPSPSAARGERAAGASDNVVVTGSRVQNRALAAPNAFEAKNPAQHYAPFLSRLQAAVKATDRPALLRLIDFPLRVNFVGGARTYRDAASVQRDFDRIFTAKVRGAVLRQRPDKLFVRDQGAMVGDGELWFRETCNNSACSPPGPVRIVAVNP